MRGSLRVVTPPTVEPVTVEEVEASMSVPTDFNAARIARLISTARALAEAFTNRALVEQTLALQLDVTEVTSLPWWDGVRQGTRAAFASNDPVVLPRPPAQSITSIKWYDRNGVEATLDSSAYYLDSGSEPARVILNTGYAWPSSMRAHAGLLITYVAGYSTNPLMVPHAVTEAIIAHVRDTIDRPNSTISAESIDNASITYGASPHSATQGTGGPSTTGGLRAEAASMLAPYRVMNMGL